MKNTVTPVRMYRDEAHEEKTRKDLAEAQSALSLLLNEWNSLNLGVCKDINALASKTPIYYEDTITGLVDVPKQSGQFQISQKKYISTLDLPCPDILYELAGHCRKTLYCMKPELWSVDGDQVTMNQAEADALIDSQSIYSDDPDKIKFVEDLDTFVDLYNSLNIRSGQDLFNSVNPIAHAFFRGKFGFQGEDQRGQGGSLMILPEYRRKLLQ